MLRKKLIRRITVDPVSTFKIVGLKILFRAKNFPRAFRLRHRRFHLCDRKNWIAHPMLDQQRPRRDEASEIRKLAQVQQSGHKITGAMEERKDAVAPVAEVSAD